MRIGPSDMADHWREWTVTREKLWRCLPKQAGFPSQSFVLLRLFTNTRFQEENCECCCERIGGEKGWPYGVSQIPSSSASDSYPPSGDPLKGRYTTFRTSLPLRVWPCQPSCVADQCRSLLGRARTVPLEQHPKPWEPERETTGGQNERGHSVRKWIKKRCGVREVNLKRRQMMAKCTERLNLKRK